MANYRIKRDYWTRFGADCNEDTTVTMSELEDLSKEWEIDIDDLMEQIEIVDEVGRSMSENAISAAAANLYDGGWRSCDRDQLISNYDITGADADAICKVLGLIEEEDKEDD